MMNVLLLVLVLEVGAGHPATLRMAGRSLWEGVVLLKLSMILNVVGGVIEGVLLVCSQRRERSGRIKVGRARRGEGGFGLVEEEVEGGLAATDGLL